MLLLFGFRSVFNTVGQDKALGWSKISNILRVSSTSFRLIDHNFNRIAACTKLTFSNKLIFFTSSTISSSLQSELYIYINYISHEMGRHIVFSSVVCPSVCPSHFRVRSISFEPLVGFTNNFAQMSTMMKRCAVSMFDQGRVKVKVTIKGQIY